MVYRSCIYWVLCSRSINIDPAYPRLDVNEAPRRERGLVPGTSPKPRTFPNIPTPNGSGRHLRLPDPSVCLTVTEWDRPGQRFMLTGIGSGWNCSCFIGMQWDVKIHSRVSEVWFVPDRGKTCIRDLPRECYASSERFVIGPGTKIFHSTSFSAKNSQFYITHSPVPPGLLQCTLYHFVCTTGLCNIVMEIKLKIWSKSLWCGCIDWQPSVHCESEGK